MTVMVPARTRTRRTEARDRRGAGQEGIGVLTTTSRRCEELEPPVQANREKIKTATSMSSQRWFATSPSGSGRRAFPQARSRCTRCQEDPRVGVHVRPRQGRDGARPTWTSCWRSASAPQRRRLARRSLRIGVIAAAGSGQRPRSGCPKALRGARRAPDLEWSLDAFRAAARSPRSWSPLRPAGRSCARAGCVAVEAGNIAPSRGKALALCAEESWWFTTPARPWSRPV